MRLRNSIRPLLLLLMLVSHCAMAQDVTVSVDRSTVFLGDTLTLTIDVIDPRSDEDLVSPDLTVLDDSFVVMNTGNTSIVNVVNGQKSTRISHTAMLEPKAAGDLTIPAITVGRMQTTPMQITVMERAASSSTSSERDLFIEAEVDQLSPYVQQQVILTVRLYHAHSILDGAIDRPEIADAVVEEISNNETYRTRIDERAYRVIERRYLVFAERSGELEIPPITFRGRIANSTNQRLLYSRSSRVSERTLPITLNVKPVPDSFTGDVWIPSSGVELREEWLDGEPQFTEGEPLTRRLVLTVSGLLSTQIPDVPVPEDPAFRIYPDDDITRMRAAQNRVIGEKESRWAIVPTQSGSFTLPEIRIPWWDVVNDTERVAVIPERSFDVSQALESVNPLQLAQLPTAQPTSATSASGQPASGGNVLLWQVVSLAMAVLWLASVFYFRGRLNRLSRQTVEEEQEEPTSQHSYTTAFSKSALKQACQNNEPHLAASQVVAMALKHDHRLTNLASIRNRLDDEVQHDQISVLERSLYHPDHEPWNGQTLWDSLKSGLHFRQATRKTEALLPPLYPQR